MRLKLTAYTALAFTFLPFIASAQTKAETKMYQKTVSKPSVAAFDKFLKKYPSSVYSAEIQAKKDTLLCISPYSLADAESIIAGFAPQGSRAKAFAWRAEGIDRVSGMAYDENKYSFILLEKGKDGWLVNTEYEVDYDDAEKGRSFDFADSSYVLKFSGEEYLRYNIVSTFAGGDSLEYKAVLFCPKAEHNSRTLSFIGKKIADGYEGKIDDGLADGMNTPQMMFLKSELQKNPILHELPMSTILTDESIRWWLQKNPDALTSAKKISFGQIPGESSLASTFEKTKKESCSKYRAAMFDIRGYSVVVALDRATGKYLLAWAEPECKDHKNGRLLNNIYFEDGSTLILFYYQGKKTFKYRLNLAEKSIKR